MPKAVVIQAKSSNKAAETDLKFTFQMPTQEEVAASPELAKGFYVNAVRTLAIRLQQKARDAVKDVPVKELLTRGSQVAQEAISKIGIMQLLAERKSTGAKLDRALGALFVKIAQGVVDQKVGMDILALRKAGKVEDTEKALKVAVPEAFVKKEKKEKAAAATK